MRVGIDELKNAYRTRASDAETGRSTSDEITTVRSTPGRRIGLIEHRVSGLSNGLAQAVERALQALVQLDLGLPAELFTRARRVECDVLHLSGALRRVLDVEAVGRVLLQDIDDVEYRLLLAEADVDRAGRVRLGGAQVRIHHVAHVHIVARLLAVAEDRGGRALEQLAAED